MSHDKSTLISHQFDSVLDHTSLHDIDTPYLHVDIVHVYATFHTHAHCT